LLRPALLFAQTNTFPPTGNVGIGTTNPQALLTINATANSNANAITIYNNDTTAGDYTAIGSYWGGNTNVTSQIRFGNELTNGAPSYLAFATGTSSTDIEQMRITSVGNVGIGTANPVTSFHVYSTGGGNPSLTSDSTETVNFQNYSVQMAQGVLNQGPYSYWMQTKQSTQSGSSFPLALNPLGGNVGIGTTAPGERLEVSGNVKLSGTGSHIAFPDGSVQSTAWTGSLCGGDYAESVDVSGDRTHYEPGDVLVLDQGHPGNFLKSSEPYSALVSGIYSTKPGVVGRRQSTEKNNAEVPMAMIGIVPTKVSAENGAIRVGDLLVSSSKPGYAMKGTDRSLLTGAVIGKAMGSLSSGTGVIEVLVTLQ